MIPTIETIARARAILASIEALQTELAVLFGAGSGKVTGKAVRAVAAKAPATAGPGSRKRRMSAAGRARIAEAAKARWEKFRAEKQKQAEKKSGK